MFPSPPKVTVDSYGWYSSYNFVKQSVSVPSRVEWGFLLEDGLNKVREAMRFSSPLEVIGGSYE